MRKTHLIIYVLFAVTAAILLLNRFTSFYISDYRVHFFFLFYAASAFAIIVGHLFNKLKSNRAILITFIVVGILCFLKAFFTWGGDWKTQTILYRNIDHPDKTIDYQMRADRFAFGYKERVIKIDKLAPFMEWTTDVDTINMDPHEWERTNIKVNEMELGEDK